MPAITCPHCGAANPSGAAFCESCGKALPSAAPSGPRVVTGDMLPTSAAGTALVTDELVKQQKQASTALLVVAVLQMVCGAIAVVIISNVNNRGGAAATPVAGTAVLLLAIQLGVAAIFFGLYFWSRKSPLPASI